MPIPPFVLPPRYALFPDALRNPGPVDVVHRDRGDLESPAGQLAAAAGRRASQLLFALVAYFLVWPWFWIRPGDVYVSQDYCHPLRLYPIALQSSERTEWASIQQKQKKVCKSSTDPCFCTLLKILIRQCPM